MKKLTLIVFGLTFHFSAHAANSRQSEFGEAPARQESCREQETNTDSLCQHFDRILSSGIQKKILQQALTFAALNPLLDQSEIIIADYSKHSSQKRLYRINLRSGDVELAKVSHGSGNLSRTTGNLNLNLHTEEMNWGDPDHDGMIDRCKIPRHAFNPSTSLSTSRENERHNMTHPGFFATRESRYLSSNEHWHRFDNRNNAVPLRGLTDGVNTEIREEDMALNAPTYNHIGHASYAIMGRGSSGPALTPQARGLLSNTEPNTIFYSFVPACPDDMTIVYDQVPGWQYMCSPNDDHKFITNCPQINNNGRFQSETENPINRAEENTQQVITR